MKEKRSVVYLHMSMRTLLALTVFVAVGAAVMFILISKGALHPPLTEEEIKVEALYVPSTPVKATAGPALTATPVPPPTPEPSPSPAEEQPGAVVLLSEYAVLSAGDDNRSVLQLQQRLAELGYMEFDEPSTLYNASVETAVMLFQRVSGLEMTGVADAALQSLLFSEAAVPYRIQPDDAGNDVSSAQQRLQALGYYTGRAGGYYGPQTEQAVKQFEYRNGLPVDGILDMTDLLQLYGYQAGMNPEASGSDPSVSAVPGTAVGRVFAHSPDGFARAATEQVDLPYVWGREGPDAFDGSGLIVYCLRLCGISVSKTLAEGYAVLEAWQKVGDTAQLNKGDLVFFTSDAGSGIVHVGIYIGGTSFVHASSSKGKVVVSSLTEPYWERNFVFGRRVFNG